MNDLAVFEFWRRCAERGVRVALVTITAVEGSSMRAPGTHMAVAEDGQAAGSISAGCVERAIVAEAVDTLRAGTARHVRFGAGSPYVDLRLPCGGALDVLITPTPDPAIARRAIKLFGQRRPFLLSLPFDGGAIALREEFPAWRSRSDEISFTVRHLPPLAITIIGHGAVVPAMHDIAQAAAALVRVITHDHDLADELRARNVDVEVLSTTDQPVDLRADAWTAIPFLFHDHDWETTLMAQALASPAFYVGAMGSRATHKRRSATLRRRGVPDPQIDRLRAPIGLIHASRLPEILALSTMTEIVRDWQAATAGPDLAPLQTVGA